MKEDPGRKRNDALNGSGESPEGPSGDVRILRHELSVHQEELKAQNEELRQAHLELSHARDRYKELFDSAPIGYLVLDGSRKIREANLTAASLLGTSRKDLIGAHLSRFMDRATADAYYLHLTEVRDRGMHQDRELVLRRPDGSVLHGLLETSPYEDALLWKGWRIALVDITDRKRAEEALREANESLERRVGERTTDLRTLAEKLEKSQDMLRRLASDLALAEERERKRVAGVLHDEIAQTLAAIRMRLDLLQDVSSDRRDRKTLEEAKDLLVQSIGETRALMNEVGNPLLFDLGLQAACESLATRLMERHPVRIRCEIREAFKRLDPDLKATLFQVVRELLNNVVRHSKARNARVTIDRDEGLLRVQVTDDGVGFDPLVLGKPARDGGFGLYSIRERLIALGGNLRIESATGAGTAATAILPERSARSNAPRQRGRKPA